MKITKLIPYLLISLFISSVPALAAERILSAQQVQQAIKLQGGEWRAKENWVSQLPVEEIRQMLGAQDAPDSDISFRAQEVQTKGPPQVLDWRNKDGRNWVTPVANQGSCGSCVAFASVATLETQMNISSSIPEMNRKYSAQHLFACGKGSCSFGWITAVAPSFLQTNGVADEACLPYTSGATGLDVKCSDACSDAASRSQKIANFVTPTKGTIDIEALKKALQKGPLLTGLRVYEDFMTYSSGVYKHTVGKMLGGHAMSIVGFDEKLRAWIVRNSWGDSWGENGYIYMSWDDDSGLGQSTWSFEVPSADGYAYVSYPKLHDYVSGTVELISASSRKDTASVQTTIINSQGMEVYSNGCRSGSECRLRWNTTKLPDGEYDVIATVTTADGATMKSPKQRFYLLNQEPRMNVTFTGSSGTDLGKPLKGNVRFSITAQSESVPMQQMEFRVTRPDGSVLRRKTTDNVLANMIMSWGTQYYPNGNYKAQMIGSIKVGQKTYSASSPVVDIALNNKK